MSEFIFLFDLDATITKKELLPRIATAAGCYQKIRELTEQTMSGNIPFRESFLRRVEFLQKIPVEQAVKIVLETPLHDDLVRFIGANKERCRIITGNLDCWIMPLMEKIGMENRTFCSHARVENNAIVQVEEVVDKHDVMHHLMEVYPHLVAVGDGDNDAEMIANAEIGIGFGAVRPIAFSVQERATYAIYTEERLCEFLKRLL